MTRSFQAAAVVLATAGAMTLASCSSKITEEQLTQLQQLRNQERTLTQQLRSGEQERTRLQGEVTTLRAQLDRCNTDKEFVNGKIQQWPNVWPDWEFTGDAATEATPNR